MQVRGRSIEAETQGDRSLGSFASATDHAECRRLHRLHGTTYYFATRLFPPRFRTRVHALYAFVRVADEWVDNPGGSIEPKGKLEAFRAELIRGLDGVCPTHPALRAFCDVIHEVRMPLDEPLRFLSAMAQDLSVTRYATYEELRQYMRGSASAVGLMMCDLLEAGENAEMIAAARCLGEAMQLTNFLRDVGEDLRRGRIYLPGEDMESFGVTEPSLCSGRVSPAFRNLMAFEIARARSLYSLADLGLPLLPGYAQRPVRVARILYSRILDRIEQNGYNVFTRRARTSPLEKIRVLARSFLSR